MGRSSKYERSAKVGLQRASHESSVASDEGSEPSSSACSCITSSTASTHYRDFSTMSSSPREKNSQNDDTLVMQNMFNKRCERLQKPCQNGFCYCFTSDSDELRFATNRAEPRQRPKHKRTTSESKTDQPKTEAQGSHKHSRPESKTYKRLSLKPFTEVKLRCDPHKDKCSKHSRRHTFVSKYALPEPLTSDKDEPLVRIIQEIHKNFVVSQISVKKGKVLKEKHGEKQGSKATSPVPTMSTDIIEPHKTIHIETKNVEYGRLKHSNIIDSQPLNPEKGKDSLEPNIPERPPRIQKKKGGHLLRKRIGDGDSFKQTNLQVPPRKPPRSFSSCSESNFTGKNTSAGSGTLGDSEQNPKLVEDVQPKSVEVHVSPSKISNIPKEEASPKYETEPPQHPPSCPSMSEMTFLQTLNNTLPVAGGVEPSNPPQIPPSHIGWVRPDLAAMLAAELGTAVPKTGFQTYQNPPQPQQPQTGWKLDIDTVDNMPKFKDNDFHNFAAYMDCKSTPVKNELLSQSAAKAAADKTLNQPKPTCTCPVKPPELQVGKKLSPIYEARKNDNLGKKTKNFFENSRKKIISFVQRKNDKRSRLRRSIAIQTSEMNLHDLTSTRKSLFRKDNLNDSFTSFRHGKPPIDKGDVISSIDTQSHERFDFNRIVNSPKAERSSSHKMKFTPSKMLKTLGSRPQEYPESYKYYDSGVNGDFTVAAMNDILVNIRARLEEDETLPIGSVDEVGKEAREVEESEELVNKLSSTQISAQVDIHSEPVYAEIKEPQANVAHQSCQTPDFPPIPPTNRNPGVIYAAIDKTKKMTKCQSFNNLMEKDNPPKIRHKSKTDLSNSSEIFLDNLFNPKRDNCSGQYVRVSISQEDMTSPAKTSSTTYLPNLPIEILKENEELNESIRYDEPHEFEIPVKPVSVDILSRKSDEAHEFDIPIKPILVGFPSRDNKTKFGSDSSSSRRSDERKKFEIPVKPSLVSFPSHKYDEHHGFLFPTKSDSDGSSSRRSNEPHNFEIPVKPASAGFPSHKCDEHHKFINPRKSGSDSSPSRRSEELHEFAIPRKSTSDSTSSRKSDEPHECAIPKKSGSDGFPSRRYDDLHDNEVPSKSGSDGSSSRRYETPPEFDIHGYYGTDDSSSRRYETPSECELPGKPGSDDSSSRRSSSFCDMGSPIFGHQNESYSHPKLPVCMVHQDVAYDDVDLPERSNSCPPSAQRTALRKYSLNNDDLSAVNLNQSTSNCKSPNTSFQKYRTLKDRLTMSFRRGKKYFKNDNKQKSISVRGDKIWDQSDLGLSSLYAIDPTDEGAVRRQIAQAVNICRQMPQFESSTELVEAERLLLFSTLKSRTGKKPSPKKSPPPPEAKECQLYIETFEIPVKSDLNHDTFFNYFYIGVFSNGPLIRSTHSAEKRHDTIFFRDCQVLFDSLDPDFQLKIDIYVLRLRKLTSRDKPAKKKIPNRSCNSSDSCDEIVSRFRLHGSAILTAEKFVPYVIHEGCSKTQTSQKFCLYSSQTNYLFPISEVTRSAHLLRELRMNARVELLQKKIEFKGFISVQDEKNTHNWNKRWCRLEALTLCFWNYPQDYSEKPCLLRIDLSRCSSFPVKSADCTVCAKKRSFVLQIDDKRFFFAAENHAELTHWLDGLNRIGDFIKRWMRPVQ